ncbi:MAG: undecaprenyl-diphosphate phosphatase [Polyangiaceae bacterium]|nr:undecaprenyl-diphosphate phosphatase [Polyangiaceae bacterium]
MSVPAGQAALLGTLQGITEFLPVSSSGHLALAELLFDVEEGGLAFNVMLHAGTLLATLIMLRRRVAPAVVEGSRALVRPQRFRESAGGRDALVVLLASLPTAAIGLALRSAVEEFTKSPLAVGIGFCITAVLLLSTRWARAGEREVPTVVGAILIGIAQGIAVVPGISRSGSTIAAALWLGVRPDRAFELSMLMSLPAVAGAVLVEARHMGGGAGGEVGLAVFGAAVAFVVGLVALWLLRRMVIRGHFALFAVWVLPLAVATLALAKAWPGS